MKKIFSILAVTAALMATGCAKDFLETEPTDKISGNMILSDSENALTALNGIYRNFNNGPWGSGWEHENGGLPAYILAFDLYAEDHAMDNYGSGWFTEDYRYGTWSDYTHNAGRSYQLWNFCYKMICNANYIIAADATMTGDENTKKYVVGQAYAIRAFMYWFLANTYCFNGGEEGSAQRATPGVPIYTEPTVAGADGKGRGTIQDTYDQMNNDIDKAIELLTATTVAKKHCSHIDKYVANGIKARICMTQRDYANALLAASQALTACPIADYTAGAPAINDANASNVMWALAVQTDQAIGNMDIMTHIDADCKSMYSKARHLISNWLYAQIPEGDGRLTWWTAPLPQSEWGTAGTSEGSKRSYCQKKIVFINPTASTGDHVLMRVEEMYLTAAEAACHLKDYQAAKLMVSAVGNNRVANYGTRLGEFMDSDMITPNNGEPVTLMDEILIQRRIELWCEFPRIFDLQRLGLGFDRNWNGTNHLYTISDKNTSAGSPNFILHIPTSEFDGNKALDKVKDQNPAFE